MNKFYLFICLFLIHFSGYACSFVPFSFCETLNNHPNRVIVSGKIVAVDDTGIDFEIMDVLKGEESKEVIRIWDGTDFDCNGWHSMAAADIGVVNDSLVLQLSVITEIVNTWDILGDYTRPNPYGEYPRLKIVNGIVNGAVEEVYPAENSFLPYDEFKDYILNNTDCFDVSSAIEDPQNKPDLKLKNPFSNSLKIYASELLNKGTITLYSLNGQAILTEKINYQNTIEIETTNLQSGIYLVEVKSEGKLPEIFKVIKM